LDGCIWTSCIAPGDRLDDQKHAVAPNHHRCRHRRRRRARTHALTAPRRTPQPKTKNQNSASYRNKENIDLSRVAGFQRSPVDTGSPEAQIARLSARVQQMSKHLIANRKDHGSKRGLERALAQRRSLMQYLYREDRAAYDRLCVELGIRNVVKGHTVQQPGQ
jgi:small subunit ribosomal protein S15